MGVAPWVPGSFIKNVERFKLSLLWLRGLVHKLPAGWGVAGVKFQMQLIQCKGDLARPGRKKH